MVESKWKTVFNSEISRNELSLRLNIESTGYLEGYKNGGTPFKITKIYELGFLNSGRYTHIMKYFVI